MSESFDALKISNDHRKHVFGTEFKPSDTLCLFYTVHFDIFLSNPAQTHAIVNNYMRANCVFHLGLHYESQRYSIKVF